MQSILIHSCRWLSHWSGIRGMRCLACGASVSVSGVQTITATIYRSENYSRHYRGSMHWKRGQRHSVMHSSRCPWQRASTLRSWHSGPSSGRVYRCNVWRAVEFRKARTANTAPPAQITMHHLWRPWPSPLPPPPSPPVTSSAHCSTAFSPRDACLNAAYAVVRCPSVCPSGCLSRSNFFTVW